jgi:hypothetical protein
VPNFLEHCDLLQIRAKICDNSLEGLSEFLFASGRHAAHLPQSIMLRRQLYRKVLKYLVSNKCFLDTNTTAIIPLLRSVFIDPLIEPSAHYVVYLIHPPRIFTYISTECRMPVCLINTGNKYYYERLGTTFMSESAHNNYTCFESGLFTSLTCSV